MKCVNKNHKKENHFDAIVIGSGLGGLCTAGLLSKINKKKVLVLEKHYEPGGLTHEFKRGPYSWDVGLHYVGDMQKRLMDKIGFMIFQFLTENKLKWNKLPLVFDKLIFPDFMIKIMDSVKSYKEALIEKFPEEKRAISKYIRDVHKIRLWYILYFFSRFLYWPLGSLCSFLTLFNKKTALMTTGEYLEKHIKNDKLKCVLASRWQLYGVPPSESAFAVHSLVEHHYYTGAIFPDGGSEKIAAYIERTIEHAGGKILTGRLVTDILIKDGKAYGVRVMNIGTRNKKVTEYYAKKIISNAGAKNTYLDLLPEKLNLPIQEKLKNFPAGYSAITLYLGLKESPEKLGITGENYWINDGYSLDLFDKNNMDAINGKLHFCFLSFPSLKNGKPGAYTADILSILPYSIFEKWKKEYWKERSNDYYKAKERLANGLISLTEKYIPGFKNLIAYKEMATPLTYKHFNNRFDGAFYGLLEIPERYNLKDLRVKTPIKNLFLTGTDILSNGILSALMSGMATAAYLNGPLGIFSIMGRVFGYKAPKEKNGEDIHEFIKKQRQTEDKIFANLIEKKTTKPKLVELTYQFEESLELIPGQHVKLCIGEGEWRAYSVAKINDNRLTLIIDTRPGGLGTKYIQKIQPGEKSFFKMPLTDLYFHNTDRKLMFITTGTGLVPFLHILEELKRINFSNEIILIFGCMHENDNFIDHYLDSYKEKLNLEINICIEEYEKSDSEAKYYRGKVTDFFIENKYNPKEYDFYICGHPHMSEAMVTLLRSMDAERVYY